MCVYMRLHIYTYTLIFLFILSVLSLYKHSLKKRVCAIKTVRDSAIF
jgi:hypothetical protein